eukprot:m51a1_g7953 putative serine threonine-protein kinase stk11 (569) ;mRNA; f:170497-182568
MGFSLQYQRRQFLGTDPSCVIYRRRVCPKRLRNYLVGDALGSGSFCVVKEGYDVVESRRVAIKIFNKRRLKRHPDWEAAIAREVAANLHVIRSGGDSAHVVRLVDHWADVAKDKTFLVFECVTGATLRSLADLAPGCRLPVAQSRSLLAQLLDGLAWLHRCGIYHRDIKPDNLMVTAEGNLVISDFGSSLVVEPAPAPGVDVECDAPGAPAFQPPEVAMTGRAPSAAKIDSWAAGLTFYVVAVGKYPFGNGNVFQTFKAISECKIHWPDTLPAELADLLRRLLAPDPAQRLSIAEAREHAWMHGAEALDRSGFVRAKPRETLFTPENLEKFLSMEEGTEQFEFSRGEQLYPYHRRRCMQFDADVVRGACKYIASCHCSMFMAQPDGYCGHCRHPYCIHPHVPAAPPLPPVAPQQPEAMDGVVLPTAPHEPMGTVDGVDMATIPPELRAVLLRLQHQCIAAQRQCAEAEAQRQRAEVEAQRQHAEAQRQGAEAEILMLRRLTVEAEKRADECERCIRIAHGLALPDCAQWRAPLLFNLIDCLDVLLSYILFPWVVKKFEVMFFLCSSAL